MHRPGKWMMLKRSTYGMPALGLFKSHCCVGGRGALLRSLRRKQGWSTHPVQILVVVANIQSRTLKTEVEKVFGRTVFGPESVGPNPRGKPPCKVEGAHGWQQSFGLLQSGGKGNRSNIPIPRCGDLKWQCR